MKMFKTLFAALGLVLACNVAANAQTSEDETVALASESAAENTFAIDNADAPQINVWPQVSSIKIMVDVEAPDTVQIYNAVGRLVKSQKVAKGQGINIETLIPGAYTVKVGGKVGSFTKK